MKILYDDQIFTFQEYGGISRYFYELNKQFKSFPEMETECSIILSNNEYLKMDNVIPSIPFFPSVKFKGKYKAMLSVNEFSSVLKYKRGKYDVFHPTYYNPYFLKYASSKPFVVTCLDMIHERYIQEDQVTIQNKKKIIERADVILAISNSTKKDLIEYYNVPEERVAVTYLASSMELSLAESEIIQPEGNQFFLYVGARNLYKNFPDFVRALSPILKKHKNLYLYCVGGGNLNSDEITLLNEIKIMDKVVVFQGSDKNLREKYSTAICFFYPSLYEGFGIPLLEAMNCGCPVAASNTSSLPEVAGDAACYFDPLDKEAILQTAEKLLNNRTLRSELRMKGFLRAKEFSWNKTARETHKVYASLL